MRLPMVTSSSAQSSTFTTTPSGNAPGSSSTRSEASSSSSSSTLTTSSADSTSASSSTTSLAGSTSGSSSGTSSSSSTASTTRTSARNSSTTPPGTSQVVLPVDVGDNESLNFQPSKIVVVIGVNNTVVWTDLDFIQHTVKSVTVPGGARMWNSGIMNEGQSFTVTLTVAGNYKYDCSIHPDWMVGTILVIQ
ncbi:MAG: plastocyanin/azurin family copper-binding protein [Thaumarchaeota archaeon]|nr:plastocyanin/azurin family copper-binding protein [Nitrososphaerota archaeon]